MNVLPPGSAWLIPARLARLELSFLGRTWLPPWSGFGLAWPGVAWLMMISAFGALSGCSLQPSWQGPFLLLCHFQCAHGRPRFGLVVLGRCDLGDLVDSMALVLISIFWFGFWFGLWDCAFRVFDYGIGYGFW